MGVLITILTSGAVATIITKVIDVWNDRTKGKSGLEKAVVSLMGMQIRNQCQHAIERGYIYYEELKQIEDMNALYQEQGGNGFVKVLMNKIQALPTNEEK